MRKFTLFLMSLFLTIGAMAQVNYTPNHTGEKTRTNRFVSSISVGGDTYTMPSGTRNSYTDLTATKTFTVEAGATVTLGITQSGIDAGWMNAFVYVDMDKNGFTAGIASDNYTPTGDLVSYSFYNQGYSDDNNGRNSAGTSITGNSRSTLALPNWTVPANLEPGEYRIRFKYDWCNINPAGDTGTYFNGTFTSHGAEIIDAKLVVFNKSELQALIAEAGELLDEVLEPHKAIGDKLNIEGKISSNAGHNRIDGNSNVENDGNGIAGLTDTDPATYFHSRWDGTAVNADHYLQINLGENNKLSDFCFEYATRKTNDHTRTSPAPTKIEVRVSADGSTFGEPIVEFTKDKNNLPAYTDLGQTLWNSGVISADNEIQYIRLTVTGSEGPGNTQWNNHYFFAMGTLNIYSTNTTFGIKEEFSNAITDAQIETINARLSEANNIKDATIGAVSKTDLDNVTATLNEALDDLRTVIYTYTLNVTSAGWATLYLDFPAAIPTVEDEEKGVFIATGMTTPGYIDLVKVTGVLPANTGVIVRMDAGEHEFTYSNGTLANVSSNLLRGSATNTYVEGLAYVLSNKNGIGLYKAELNFDATGNKVGKETGTHFLNNANKAYLPDGTGSSNIASYSFRFGEGTTGVEEVKAENGEVKAIYDLTGRRVEAITAPGIYIVGGKKVLVK